MLSKEHFKQIYTNQLKNSFKSFDTRRKIGVIVDVMGFVPFVGTFLILIPIMFISENRTEAMGVLLVVGAFGGFVFIMLMKWIVEKIHNPLKEQYHEKFIKPIVNSISPDWQYSIDGSVGALEVGSSKLFDKNYEEYSGNNLVYGKIDKTDFRSSLLTIAYKKSHPQDDDTPHFNGFFFHADFNKHFNGDTVVINGDLKDMAVAFKNMPVSSRYVVLENQEFNKVFKVKATDQTEARYILTPVIMEKLLKIQKYYNAPIRFSFTGKRVYCAIYRTNHLLKLPFYKAINTWKFVEKIYDLYALNVVLVKELNLNTRIWTKE